MKQLVAYATSTTRPKELPGGLMNKRIFILYTIILRTRHPRLIRCKNFLRRVGHKTIVWRFCSIEGNRCLCVSGKEFNVRTFHVSVKWNAPFYFIKNYLQLVLNISPLTTPLISYLPACTQ